MADGTHASNIIGNMKVGTSDPANPEIGDTYFNTTFNRWCRWSGSNWLVHQFSTTSTSTSSSTSTSTSTTSTSSSTTSSTSTSSSTSTTTTG